LKKLFYNTIVDYLRPNPRNKIIIYQNDNWELSATDIGWHLSAYFHNSKEGNNLPMVASKKLSEILHDARYHHPVFGNTLAITNIGILLEPALKLNFPGFLDNFSQNNSLFLHWPGESDAESLYFLAKDQGIKIHIGNLSHIKI
jgi:hypothetical protein